MRARIPLKPGQTHSQIEKNATLLRRTNQTERKQQSTAKSQFALRAVLSGWPREIALFFVSARFIANQGNCIRFHGVCACVWTCERVCLCVCLCTHTPLRLSAEQMSCMCVQGDNQLTGLSCYIETPFI